MDVQVQVTLPFSGWDIFPLPTVASTADPYELVITLQLPSLQLPTFVYKLFRVEVVQPTEPEPVRYELPEESFLVKETRRLLELGSVSLCEEGVGGTYFIKNKDGSSFAIFKPSDEEPGAPNNPKNIVQNPLLPHGGGAVREVAAYLLDRDHFAGVPETQLLSKVSHNGFHTTDEKCGSVQLFVENDGDSSNFGTSIFQTEDVHRIGILDIRIYNMDRNGENMLVVRENGKNRLVPIDHTYCLPRVDQMNGPFFEWQYWPQAKQPFSQQSQDFINSIDIEQEKAILRTLGISEESILTMVVSTMLLKEASAAGWTLFDIACLMSRGIPLDKQSKFEEVVSACMAQSSDFGPVKDAPSFLELYQQSLKDLVSASQNTI